MIKLALVQATACDDISVNLQTLADYTAAAAHAGCQVICFPECFLTGYAPEEADVRAVSAASVIFDRISRLAVTHSMDILAGFMEKSGTRFHITHGLWRKDGSREYYRKTHLGKREQLFFSPGKELPVFSLSDGTCIGIALCVETHYPEIAQTLALKGATVIFAPHAVPRVSGDREAIWGKYIPARSYDNRVYMACCNLWDADRFGGGCMVTGPRGEVTASCFRDAPSLLVCELQPETAASFRDPENKRSRHFYPAFRKKDLYV